MDVAFQPLIYADEDVESGGKDPHYNIEDDFMYRNNVHQASIQIRLGFIRKVYSLLSVQLLLTIAIGFAFYSNTQLKSFVITNNWVIILSLFLNIGVLIALHVKRRHYPVNLILLATFTVIEAPSLGFIVSLYDARIVLQALLLTFVVVVSITAFTFQTQYDFTGIQTSLFAALLVLIVASFLQLIFRSTALEFVLSIGGAVLFSIFLIYDTQAMLKIVSPEEYIVAVINLYLDIINLFLYILRMLDAIRR